MKASVYAKISNSRNELKSDCSTAHDSLNIVAKCNC